MSDPEDTPVTTPQPGEIGPITPEEQEQNNKVDDIVVGLMERMPGGYINLDEYYTYLVEQLNGIGVGIIQASKDNITNRNIILESFGRLVESGKVCSKHNNGEYFFVAKMAHPESSSGFQVSDQSQPSSNQWQTWPDGTPAGVEVAASGGGLPRSSPANDSWMDSHPGPSSYTGQRG